MSIEQSIITIVRTHGSDTPIGRHELCKLVGCGDRHMREIIAHVPDIGQANAGYFWKHTEADFTIHDNYIKSTMRAERERLERNRQRRLDRQHEPGFGIVENWHEIPRPSFLMRRV